MANDKSKRRIEKSNEESLTETTNDSIGSYTVESYCNGTYRDFINVPTKTIKRIINCPQGKRSGPRGGVVIPFPVRLYNMLEGVARESQEDIVSWLPHGRCFVVRKTREFVDEVMPRYFHQSKLTSFQRQLNLYGFLRLTNSPDRGGYYHELFLRGRPDLCREMLRTRVKRTSTGVATPSESAELPNFNMMPVCAGKRKECEENDTEKYPPPIVSVSDESSILNKEINLLATNTKPVPGSGEGKWCRIFAFASKSPMFEESSQSNEILPQSLIDLMQEPVPEFGTDILLAEIEPTPIREDLLSSFHSRLRLLAHRPSKDSTDCETGFFEGHPFKCMDESALQAFEASMIHDIV